jgi:membrane protease YdiL (CAAX protease family)
MSSSRSSAFFVALIFIAIVLIQYVFVYSDVGYGIVLSLLITLIIYITISVLKNRSDLTRLAESLALIPLYVLFTSSLPWFFIEQQFLLPMVYSLILGLCFWHMNEYNLGFKDVGIIKKNALKYALLGILIAIPTGIIEYLILRPAPAFPKFEYIYLIRDVAYMTFFVAFGEELLFRGIIMNDLKRIYSWKTALIAQGFLFGIMHMSWRSVPELGFTFTAGILFGYLYHKTGSLTSSLAMHSMNNVILVGVLPYLL